MLVAQISKILGYKEAKRMRCLETRYGNTVHIIPYFQHFLVVRVVTPREARDLKERKWPVKEIAASKFVA